MASSNFSKDMKEDGGAPAPHAKGSATLIDLFRVLAANRRKLIAVPLIAGFLTGAASFLITPRFTASNRFLPPQQQQSMASSMLQSLGAIGGLASAASALKNPTDQYLAFLGTRVVQDSLVHRFDLQARYDKKYLEDTRRALAANSEFSAKDGLITVQFTDQDPKFAASVANGYVDALGELMSRLAVTEAQQRRKFFEVQLQAAKDNLIKAEQVLAASGVSVSTLNANPSTALEGPARLRAQVTAQEVKIASMRSYLAPGANEMRQAVAELSALKSQLLAAERETPASKGSGSNDYIAKYREFRYQETLFELFSRQYEIARLDESKDGSVVQVVDPAIEPEKKSSPRRALLVLFAMIGTFTLVLIFVLARATYRYYQASDPAFADSMNELKKSWRS